MNSTYAKTLVLFDVGGVLVSLDFQSYYERATSHTHGITADDFKKKLIESKVDYSACKGLITENDYISELRNILNYSKWISTETLKSAIAAAWKGQINEMVELKDKLNRVGYSVGILSNMHAIAHKQIHTMYPRVFETFDVESPKIFSFQVGAMKPELSIYRKVTGYENIIYIEDRELYLKIPVEELGWKGVLFTQYIDETELIRALHKNRSTSSWTQRLRVANSFTDIKECLLEFGVHI